MDNLTENKKSWLLIRAADLKIYFDHEPIGPPDDLLYNEYYMHEAWRIAEWAWENLPTDTIKDGRNTTTAQRIFQIFWATTMRPVVGRECQHLWLDKILSLLIETGKVEIHDES